MYDALDAKYNLDSLYVQNNVAVASTLLGKTMTSTRQTQSPADKPPKRETGQIQPRYIWLRNRLLQELQSGKYPVGSLFPTEEQLATTYKVSRHTVREATRLLVQNGLISRRRSTGTVVTATQQHAPYVAALGTLQELMQYTYTTRLEVFRKEPVVIDEELANFFGVEPESNWLLLHSHRHRLNEVRPISYTLVYLRPEYAEIADHLKGNHPSIFNLHEQLFNKPVASVIQKIDADNLPAEAAKTMEICPSTPCLKMTRCYLDDTGRVISASINYYPPERFQLVTRWDRDSTNTNTYNANHTDRHAQP